jgi:hypothetical protein
VLTNEEIKHYAKYGFHNSGQIDQFLKSDGDPYVLRPFKDLGRSWVAVNNAPPGAPPKEEVFMTNTPALLTRYDWELVDREVNWNTKDELVFANMVFARNPVNIPNGYSKLSIQHTNGDYDADAIVSMDPGRRSERSKPVADKVSLPLPVVHSDNNWGSRELAVSRTGQMPLDLVGFRAAGRKIGEVIEGMFLGTTASYADMGGTIYGLTNFPQRTTYTTMTAPTAGGYAPVNTIDQLLAMIQAALVNKFSGPFVLLHSRDWMLHLGKDYSAQYPGVTLRDRIRGIGPVISDMVMVPQLPAFTMILVQMTSDVIEGLNGMDVITVQWTTEGGMNIHFKTMCIKVPRLRYNYAGFAGLVHGTTS